MSRQEILFALMAALVLAIFLSPLASSWPDGLEKVAEDEGFLEKGEIEPAFTSPIPDYAWPGIENEGVATALAGLTGTLLVFGLGYGLASLVKRTYS